MNEPAMNITNQLNAALNDVRSTLVDMATWAETPATTRVAQMDKARYQLELAMVMVWEHRAGTSVPWSDRKYQVDEEFS